jgi:hypothetical protein
MFKGFSDSSRNKEFHGFPNLNFQMNNEAYGFSGCTFWLDAAYGLNTQTNLAAVTEWNDKIINIKFTQSTAANQPVYLTSVAEFNNYPAIHFVDTTDFMSSNLFGSGVTYAIVAKVNLISAGGNVLLTTSVASVNSISLAGDDPDIVGIGIYGAGGLGASLMNTTIEDTNPHIIIITPTEIVVDGVQSATSSGVALSGFNTLGGANTSRRILGYVGEIICFDKHFNSQECITLSTNINSKYAIY